jgi:nitroimidazol reductase NimA-like FMN-containing flavoprotein (pyridoxamine 5'-phosphate oxidase superfamily)
MDTVSEKYPPMRRKDRAMSEEAAIQILKDGEYGILATCGEDRQPYGVPLSYVYHDGRIYFHGAKTGHKLQNLSCSPKASFTVVGHTHVLQEAFSTAYRSAIAFGEVSPVEEARQAEALMLLAEKYCYDNLANAESYIQKMLGYVGVYCMEIQHLTGKARPEMK